MSYDVNRAIRTVKTGSPRDKAVLFLLADMADDNGVAWPSISRIAEYTELSRRSVDRAIRSLRETGLVLVEKVRRGERKHSNRYRINLSTIDRLSDEQRQSDAA